MRSITKNDVKRLKQAIRVFDGVMTELNVTLVDTGDTHTVRGHIGIRSSGSPLSNSSALGLTGASDQDKMVCVVPTDNWDAVVSTRAPKKGDVFEKQGIRYAVQRIIKASPGDVDMMYKMELRG